MARNITYESCTLVYTLLNPDVLNFNDFNLIVRSLHSFMVEDIIPHENANNVHVKLGYQASVINAQRKLGKKLINLIGVSKLSSHIKESEFSRLEQLRRKYGLDCQSDEQLGHKPRGSGGNRSRGRLFKPRPAPYNTKKALQQPKTSPVWEDIPDAQTFPTSFQEGEMLEPSSDDNTEN